MAVGHWSWSAAALAVVMGAAGAAQAPAMPDKHALAELDGFALGMAEVGRFSGVVLVARDGQVLFEKAYGKRDEKAETAPNTLETRFNLASAGKMFTAVAVLQQVAAGKLTLDTRVGEVLKDYPNREFAKVTVRQLLTHTAGAGDIDLFGTEHAANRAKARTVAQMVALHATRAPAFAPGTSQEYGNYGHVVLGRMVEVVSGQDFESYVRAHVFQPAGMEHTGFVDCASTADDLAVGYVALKGERVSNCNTVPARGFPAGGHVSTARDMYRFVRALQDGKLLPPKLFAEATRTHHEFMGLGFFATGYGPGVPTREFRWGHGGAADGICADVRTHPSTGETIIVLSNVEPPDCFPVANFLHRRWGEREKAGGLAASPAR